jgi:uncharacterized protein YraI
MTGTSVPSAASAAPSLQGTVTARVGSNLRTGPDTTSAVVRTLPCGTRLSIKEMSGDWFRVQVLGITGWVYSWYVSLAGPSP